MDISPRSRRDLECHEHHGEISKISARSRQSRRVLGNLGEMEHISPRSRRDLESNKNHGEISARSLQSRRDLINLANLGRNLTINVKKQIEVSFSCVCPVIDNEFRHNIVKVVCGTTRLLPRGSTATLTM